MLHFQSPFRLGDGHDRKRCRLTEEGSITRKPHPQSTEDAVPATDFTVMIFPDRFYFIIGATALHE